MSVYNERLWGELMVLKDEGYSVRQIAEKKGI
jgi:hypothetical protein